MTQLDLFDTRPSFEEVMAAPATWYEGVPERSGLAQYTVALRSRFDPQPKSRREKHRDGQGFEAWREDLAGDPRRWAAAIVRLLRDRQSRTFNRVALELTGYQYTADVAMAKAPEVGLWLAVERGLLWWAEFEGCIWFAARPLNHEPGRVRC